MAKTSWDDAIWDAMMSSVVRNCWEFLVVTGNASRIYQMTELREDPNGY